MPRRNTTTPLARCASCDKQFRFSDDGQQHWCGATACRHFRYRNDHAYRERALAMTRERWRQTRAEDRQRRLAARERSRAITARLTAAGAKRSPAPPIPLLGSLGIAGGTGGGDPRDQGAALE